MGERTFNAQHSHAGARITHRQFAIDYFQFEPKNEEFNPIISSSGGAGIFCYGGGIFGWVRGENG
jgi:hypothetical protein